MNLQTLVTTHPIVRDTGHLLALLEHYGSESIGWQFHAGQLFLSHPLTEEDEGDTMLLRSQNYFSGKNGKGKGKEKAPTKPTTSAPGRRSKRLQNQETGGDQSSTASDPEVPESTKRGREPGGDGQRSKKRAKRAVSRNLSTTGARSDLDAIVRQLPFTVLADLLSSQDEEPADLRRAIYLYLNGMLQEDVAKMDDAEKNYPNEFAEWLLSRQGKTIDLATTLRYLARLDEQGARSEVEIANDPQLVQLDLDRRRARQRSVAYTTLINAARDGDIDLAKIALNTAGLPWTLEQQDLAISYAAMQNTEILKLLLNYGDDDGRTTNFDIEVERLEQSQIFDELSTRTINITRQGLGNYLFLCAMHGQNWEALRFLTQWTLRVPKEEEGGALIYFISPQSPIMPNSIARLATFVERGVLQGSRSMYRGPRRAGRGSALSLIPVDPRARSDFLAWLLFDHRLEGLKIMLTWRPPRGVRDQPLVDANQKEYLLEACRSHAVYSMSNDTIAYLITGYELDLTESAMTGEIAQARDAFKTRANRPKPTAESVEAVNQMLEKLPGIRLFRIRIDVTRNSRACLRYLVMARDARPIKTYLNWRGKSDEYVDPRQHDYEAAKLAVRLGRLAALQQLADWFQKPNNRLDMTYKNYILWRIHWNNLSLRLESPTTYEAMTRVFKNAKAVAPGHSAQQQNGPNTLDFLARRKRVKAAYGALREVPDSPFDVDRDIEELITAFSKREADIDDWLDADFSILGVDEESEYEDDSSFSEMRQGWNDDDENGGSSPPFTMM